MNKSIYLPLIAIFIALSSTSVYAKKILLKTPVVFSTSLPALGSPILYVAERLGVISGGSLRMKVYEPKKLVAPFEILDAVSSGKVNSGYSIAGYWTGKMPAAPLFSAIPFGPEAGEFMAWMYHGDGLELYQEMYDSNGFNVKVIPCAIIPPETSGWFAKEINSPSDLKGLKIRFFGLGGQVMQKIGAQTSLLPGAEIYPALEKGAIDATEFSLPEVDKRLGFYKLVKHNYFPGWHQQTTLAELLINKKVWNSMDSQQQAVINTVCEASLMRSFARGEAGQYAAMQENVDKHGVKLHYWSDSMLNTFESAWNEVVKEQVANDKFFAKVWASQQAFRKGYKVWQSYGFLPRERN